MIIKRLILFFTISVFVVSCYKFKDPKKPDNLISKDKMVDVLIDFKLVSSVNSKNRKLLIQQGIDYNNYVFVKHDIDSLQFAESNLYYSYDFDTYQSIYDKVIDSLTQLQNYYNELAEAEKKEKEDAKDLDDIEIDDEDLELDEIDIDSSRIKRRLKKRGKLKVDDDELEDLDDIEELIQEEQLISPVSDTIRQ